MIIVTGSKRSGTSMWMQALRAAGFPVLGRRFPRDWGETIRDANRQGFYETTLRHGIYYATNPSPRTGAFLAPADTRRHAVKVFAQGMAKSDLAYADFVIATVRDFREYRASLHRLYHMERENKLLRAQREGRPASSVPELAFPPAALEWWNDNYTVLRDARARGYPIRVVSYGAVLRAPEKLIGETLAWLGGGDTRRAVGAVKAELRTQRADQSAPMQAPPADYGAVFDELYQRIDCERGVDDAFFERLSEVHARLLPHIQTAELMAREARRRERERVRGTRSVARPDEREA